MKSYAILLLALLAGSCVTGRHTSHFSTNAIALGMDEELFTKKYGLPLSMDRTAEGYDNLYYKESIYQGKWYIITT